MSSNSDTHHDASTYYVPHGSQWPILGSVALFTLMTGVISYLNEWAGGWAFIPGALLLAVSVQVKGGGAGIGGQISKAMEKAISSVAQP